MRLKTKRNIFTGLKTITAALLIILQVYPIFYVIISSMKTTDDFRSLPSYALPSALNFENYIKVFTTSPMLNYFKNSIIIHMLPVLGGVQHKLYCWSLGSLILFSRRTRNSW